MPRPQQSNPWENASRISFPELVTTIGGGTAFSVDKLVSMMATAEKKEEDFRIVHQETHFIVPLGFIHEYFKDHARPVPRMTMKEELEYLRNKNAELEARLQETGLPGTEMKPHPRFMPRSEERDYSSAPPSRDIDIPFVPPERMTPEAIQDELRKDLQGQGATPISRRTPAAKRAMAEDKL
jgi:hypothetical protein